MRRRRGAALVLALGFVVLLTGLVLAFLSRSQTERSISTASSNFSQVDLLANGAVDTILGDLKQEIVDGSQPVAVNGATLYIPTAPANAAPALAGSTGTGGLENLIKRSAYSVSFYLSGPSRAAATPTTTPSLNGRSISPARWNRHYLLQKEDVSNANDSTPVTSFTVPDWIMVARDGSNPNAWNANHTIRGANPVLGRYAFAIYNEGGLIDINAAGYPSTSTPQDTGKKQSLAYADLQQLGLTSAQADGIVAWRNMASLQTPGASFLAPNFSPDSAERYRRYVSSNTRGFMQVASRTLHPTGNQSDQMFGSRQQLIQFLQRGLATNENERAQLQESLRYLGTFSRVLNQPSFRPHPNRPKVISNMYAGPPSTTYGGGNSAHNLDDLVNPAFRSMRVTSEFTRNDGTTAEVGEPLVKRRFALNRLCWITYKGPSASVAETDEVIQEFLNQGISSELIEQGTAENILKHFGLTWTPGAGTDGAGGYWTYNHGIANTIGTLEAVRDANRDPDFFEMLKAGVHVGAIARAALGINANLDTLSVQDVVKEASRVDNHIIQIGANIIDQAAPENFPTNIVFDDGTRPRSFWGQVDLPYWYGFNISGVLVRQANPPPPLDGLPVTPKQEIIDPGLGAGLMVPLIWNPHTASPTPLPSGGKPTQLRISISNFGVHAASTMSASPNSFWYRTFPRFRHSAGSISQSLVLAPWSTGTLNQARGIIDMPAENTSGNTALYFDVGTEELYREPTPLLRAGFPAGSNLRMDGGNAMTRSAPLVAGQSAGDPAWNNGIPELGSGLRYLGFFLGKFAQRYNATSYTDASQQSTYTTNGLGQQPANTGYTISMEYKSGNVWVPYHQQTMPLSIVNGDNSMAFGVGGANPYHKSVLDNWASGGGAASGITGQVNFVQVGALTMDPRARRWPQNGSHPMKPFLDSNKSFMSTFRPGAEKGDNSHGFHFGGSSKDMWFERVENGSSYRVDADGTVRRPMGAYVPGGPAASTTVGLPLATAFGNALNANNRPVLLHRPFRSVAELGYVFSATPWKNIDFFTPESGFSALLDIFCINEDQRTDALVAGKVDLNTRQPAVIKALLAGSNRDEFGSASNLSSAEIESIATALVNYTASTDADKGPFANLADLVGRYGDGFTNGVTPVAGANSYAGFSTQLTAAYEGGSTSPNKIVQRFRESTMRSLSAGGQAGTWNLLIDVIAQSGRYPSSAEGFADFNVEGERRFWVHVAIDRQSGQIIDQQIEVVNE